MESNAASRLIVALDYPAAGPALALVDSLQGRLRWVKVGLELYLAAGNEILHALQDRGLKVFLDLKLHDIPNTVAGAIHALAGCGAELLTVHGLGGPAMLKSAQDAANRTNGPRLLAVTILTSMDAAQLTAIGISNSPAKEVLQLARLAKSLGLSGLVCSSEEVVQLRTELGSDVVLVVPGIRPLGASSGDQTRTATPGEAIRAGASMLVVGRPITQAKDPRLAFETILAEIEGALK